MFLRSIRFKMIIWYMVILTITLSVFSYLVYEEYNIHIQEWMDNLLSSKAQGIADSIDTYWESEKIEAIKDGALANLFSKVNNMNFLKIAKSWVEEKSEDIRYINFVVQIFNSKGKLIVSSKDIPNIKQLPNMLFKDILHGKTHFYTIDAQNYDKSPVAMRVYAMSVIENNQVAYVIQVARPLESMRSAKNNLKRLFEIYLPITVILTGMIGAFLAKMSLAPVDRMSANLRKITAHTLKDRIPVPKTRDELQRLAETFNTMLTELDSAFTMQQQFMSDVSHELRTPLTILKGEVEVVLKRERSPSEYQSVLKSSLEEVNRLISLIEELLILAKIEGAKVSKDFAAVDVNRLIDQAYDSLEILAQKKEVELHKSVASDVVMILGNESQLIRLLYILIDNAIKYTPAKGTVHIETQVQGGNLLIIVKDTGVGIAPSDLPHVFDRFFQADRSRHFEGFGLGLSLAKAIVQRHQGEIAIVSDIGLGTVVQVHFPRETNPTQD